MNNHAEDSGSWPSGPAPSGWPMDNNAATKPGRSTATPATDRGTRSALHTSAYSAPYISGGPSGMNSPQMNPGLWSQSHQPSGFQPLYQSAPTYPNANTATPFGIPAAHHAFHSHSSHHGHPTHGPQREFDQSFAPPPGPVPYWRRRHAGLSSDFSAHHESLPTKNFGNWDPNFDGPQLTSKEKDMMTRELILEFREEAVIAREDAVAAKEYKVATREKEVRLREKALRSQERQILERISLVEGREAEVNDNRTSIAARWGEAWPKRSSSSFSGNGMKTPTESAGLHISDLTVERLGLDVGLLKDRLLVVEKKVRDIEDDNTAREWGKPDVGPWKNRLYCLENKVRDMNQDMDPRAWGCNSNASKGSFGNPFETKTNGGWGDVAGKTAKSSGWGGDQDDNSSVGGLGWGGNWDNESSIREWGGRESGRQHKC